MTSTKTAERDWSATLFLPQWSTPFPMKAGLPELEPRLLKRWAGLGMYGRLRKAAKGKPKFILHDGPPYANGNIHIGTALNKILKDMVTRGQQMLAYDSNYVPGWDCHGLPIEWQIEQAYRAKGKRKEDVPVLELIAECRDFAQKWIDIQREEFKRLGVEGDWDHPVHDDGARRRGADRARADEVRGHRPALPRLQAGDVERGGENRARRGGDRVPRVHERHGVGEVPGRPGSRSRRPQVGPATKRSGPGASVVIWTTTPWTLPGNRAIAFSSKIAYGLYEVTNGA